MDRDRIKRILPIIGIAAVLLFFWNSPVVWPLKILVVFFHELGHALAALVTGGEVLSIGLSPDQGGVTHTRGGFRLLILNAGYLGSLAFGMVLLFAARSERGARIGVACLAVLLVFATVVWVRPLASFGFAFALLTSGAIAVLARKGPDDVVQLALRTLGVFSVLYALWDIRSDVLSGRTGLSDAAMLAEATWIPAPVWGVMWLALGGFALWRTRHWW